MRLSAKILESVSGINSWKYANQAYVAEGAVNNIYIQLVDLLKTAEINPKSKALPDNPLRYISAATVVSVSATFPSIDDGEIFTVIGVQPFADDKSIWKFTLTSSQLPASGSFQVTLTEDGVSRSFNVQNSIAVELLNSGGC